MINADDDKNIHFYHFKSRESSRMIIGFHQKAGTGKLTGVYRKYSTSKFGYAAKYAPGDFLLVNMETTGNEGHSH